VSKQPLDRLRSRKKPVSKRVPIFDTELADRSEQLRQVAADARERSNRSPGDAALQAAAQDAEEDAVRALDEAVQSADWFVVRSLSPRAYEDLANAHPPTSDQLKDARKQGLMQLAWNPDTFPDALLASCVSYEDSETGEQAQLDESFVKEMHESDDWNAAEIGALVQAAVEVNSVRRVVDVGKGSRLTRSS
jgi:hypothetical protein